VLERIFRLSSSKDDCGPSHFRSCDQQRAQRLLRAEAVSASARRCSDRVACEGKSSADPREDGRHQLGWMLCRNGSHSFSRHTVEDRALLGHEKLAVDGVVVSCHPQFGNGIEFSGLSQASQLKLQRFLESESESKQE